MWSFWLTYLFWVDLGCILYQTSQLITSAGRGASQMGWNSLKVCSLNAFKLLNFLFEGLHYYRDNICFSNYYCLLKCSINCLLSNPTQTCFNPLPNTLHSPCFNMYGSLIAGNIWFGSCSCSISFKGRLLCCSWCVIVLILYNQMLSFLSFIQCKDSWWHLCI